MHLNHLKAYLLSLKDVFKSLIGFFNNSMVYLKSLKGVSNITQGCIYNYSKLQNVKNKLIQ